MDLRIVNTCNNDCLYCLEQDLRKDEKYRSFTDICKDLDVEENREVLCFYGWNPLLHPKLKDILKYAQKIWYKNISLLSNTHGLDAWLAQELKEVGLNTIQFYFHSFDEKTHDAIVQKGITLKELLSNMKLIHTLWMQHTAIIHVNAQNINSLLKDIKALHKYFSLNSFELINYYPVSRAYEKYDSLLRYEEDMTKIKMIQKFVDEIQWRLRLTRFSL